MEGLPWLLSIKMEGGFCMTEMNGIPEENKVDIWAKVIVAKNIQKDEPILGGYDEEGNPDPYNIEVEGLKNDEYIICIDDFKVIFDQDEVKEDFICTSKVLVTIPFKAFLWVRTNEGYSCVRVEWTFKKAIPICEFIKLDGKQLTQQEFKDNVDQSKVVVKDYQLEYVNVVPKSACSPDEQIIEVILTATVIDKLGKYQDVIVYGCIPEC